MDWPVPAAHVRHAAHELCPALSVKVPAAHAAHTRSLLAVAAFAVCWPAAHGALTAAHASPLSTDENVLPATHGAHTRSVLGVPSTDSPEPTPHVDHAAHCACPALDVNCPCAHDAHTRSLLAVAAFEVRCPAAHGARTAEQAPPSLRVENVLPTTHGAQSRSAVALPSCSRPLPTPHVFHAAHFSLPRVALNCPAAHVAQVKSAVSVAALSMYCPGAHGSRTAVHAAPLSLPENVAPSEQRLHVRSVVAEPAVSSPEPAAHVDHAVHAALPVLALK